MRLFEKIFKKEKSLPKEYHLGICLSGGGALGLAHIGVLQALNEHHIFPDAVSGSSMGAIIGTLYSAGYSPKEMLQMIKEDKLYKITNLMNFKPAFWKSGLSDQSAIYALFEEMIPQNNFDSLKLSMNICVVNLNKAEWEIKNSGSDLNKWVAASASIPGVFNPVESDGVVYVDGGLLNNLPLEPLAETCEKLIAVDVLPYAFDAKKYKQKDIVINSIRASQHQNSKRNRDKSHFLIEPMAIEKYHEFDFDKYLEIYEYGYKSVSKAFIDEITSKNNVLTS